MSDAELPLGIMGCKPEGRSDGRPKIRWMDGVVGDIMKLGSKSWWSVARDGVTERSCAGSRDSHRALVLMMTTFKNGDQ